MKIGKKQSVCAKCKAKIIWNKAFIEERNKDINIKTAIERGFCPQCGFIYLPPSPNYVLIAIREDTNQSFTFANGDTFNSVFHLVPVFRGILNALDTRVRLRIIGKSEEMSNKTDNAFQVLYEEQIVGSSKSMNFLN